MAPHSVQPARVPLESFFKGRRRGLQPDHLRAIYDLLGVKPWPYAEFGESGYLTLMSEAKYRPGAYIKIDKDGAAKVLTVGHWQARRAKSGHAVDTFDLPKTPKEVHTHGVVQFYAMSLGLQREVLEGPAKGKLYIPRAVYNALAVLLLLRVGAVPAPDVAAHAVDVFKALADAIFAGVEAGKARVEGAFALCRMLEILMRLQQAHTWLANTGAIQPAPLAPWFVFRVQDECEVPELRAALNERCRWYAMNRYLPVNEKRERAESDAEAAEYLDNRAFQTTQRRLAMELLGQAGEDFEAYWHPQDNPTLDERRWHQLVKQAQALGLIEKVGAVAHALDEGQPNDERAGRPITLWALTASQVPQETRVRHPRPKPSRKILAGKLLDR